ncbi:MAG: CCA tRNA nucleotidyltransferase [Candidatus Omnitrophica bacterium]|jgi:tRNA nucleotidyltransferase (CCA-adding enzyme)|nr:CCA tRNA nucleotidyltransferase [Candidatus Omnitrophota bacterium]MDD5660988.1 CCA tRNA nucleotidyltransferase [Candidatus Omnitrophota bacterium]
MKEYFKLLPQKLKTIVSCIAQVSEETHMPAYLVGGFLRDLILQVKNFDLDIAVEGNGIIFAEHLAGKLKSELRTHERFGTATLLLDGFLKIDIATTRKEEYSSCASLPEVRFSPLQDDLMRRDFTINAMAVSISEGCAQVLIDPFGGKDDLSCGVIRILHDLSFEDDPTRILRAIRFEQRFNFKIEPKTLSLINDAVKKGMLNKVSPHRIRDELVLMLKEGNLLKQIKRLDSLCSLSFIDKKLKATKSTYDLFKSIDKEVIWFNNNFCGYRQLDTWLIYFTALLLPLALREVKKITSRLSLCRGEAKRIISYYVLRHKLIRALSKKNVLPARIFTMLEPLSYETIILLKSSSSNKYLKKYIANFLEIYNGMRLYISGKDLAGMGLLPGPRYQKIFAKVLEAKLNGVVENRRQELVLIKKLIKTTN